MSLRVLLTLAAVVVLGTVANAAVLISIPAKPSPMERLAALEVQRYVYLRTGVVPSLSGKAGQERIVIAKKGDPIIAAAVAKEANALSNQQYLIRTVRSGGKTTWWIVGGDDVGTLYGAYKFVEELGARFYLHGDVIPDKRLTKLPVVNETGKPIFSIRGIQPFHDFPEGPDWWNTDDYLAYISQLAKMRMNFIGLHCYPGHMAEPSVWIGMPSDVDASGKVTFSHPSRWASTALDKFWGYKATPTSKFCAGASMLFPADGYGNEVTEGMLPAPTTPEQCNTVFNNAGTMFNTAFGFARSVGVKTCVGTETPLTVPSAVAAKLKEQGKDPKNPEVVKDLYKGMFTRIARAYPVDYYWLWTPEGWTWGGNNEAQLKATVDDISSALGALDAIGNPFTLATCGWVLGPAHDRAALDRVLPKQCPMSCINRSVGHAPVEPAFENVVGRPKWAIPWMENDPVMTAPQPWVGRMRYDATDAKVLGCTGLLGIHWRTKTMAQNVAALADAAWDQSYVPAGFVKARTAPDTRIGPLGGRVVTYQNPVEGTEDDPVYQSVRYYLDGYRLKTPNGSYTVTLQFNEPHYNEAGKRVFGVKLQGKTVIDRLDMIEKAGKNKAIDYVYKDVKVADSALMIEFIAIIEYPCIAGIVIEGRTDDGKAFTRKINCGGDEYHDYEADKAELRDKSDGRTMPVWDFYLDFARASFGDAVAVEAARILAQIDGRGLPEPVGWINGPGCVVANKEPWTTVRERYGFVDKLTALRGRIKSRGDLERFDYWLNTYKYMRSLAATGCTRGELDMKMEALAATTDPDAKKSLAREAIALRSRLSRLWEQTITLLLAHTDTPGEMGTLDNLERHSREQQQFLSQHDEAITKAWGAPLPDHIELTSNYLGTPRVTVPTVRGQVKPGEALRVKVLILGKSAPTNAGLYWRPLGQGIYKKIELKHINRGVYEATLPPARNSFEYYVDVYTPEANLMWPALGSKMSQTVVVW